MEEVLRNGIGFRRFFKHMPVATLIIGAFWIFILILGTVLGFSLTNLLSDAVQRFGMWGLLVLAMVPSIQSGTGPNFALPIGVCCGLLAIVISIEIGLTGGLLFAVAAILAVAIGCVMGYVYGQLMNAVKGSEMAIATYTGFSVTFLFCVIWTALPFANPYIMWFIGAGLRNYISLEPLGAVKVLDNIMHFSIGGISIPTGMILVVLIASLLMWLFFRSKPGISIMAVGMNPRFAAVSGIDVDKSRTLANMISTALAAVGILVYAQSFGLVQLYDGPMLMAFPAVAAVLVGGASAHKSKVINVIVGTIIFQGLITNGPPVFGRLLQGADMTDAVRMVVQNGVILYALAQMRGGGKS